MNGHPASFLRHCSLMAIVFVSALAGCNMNYDEVRPAVYGMNKEFEPRLNAEWVTSTSPIHPDSWVEFESSGVSFLKISANDSFQRPTLTMLSNEIMTLNQIIHLVGSAPPYPKALFIKRTDDKASTTLSLPDNFATLVEERKKEIVQAPLKQKAVEEYLRQQALKAEEDRKRQVALQLKQQQEAALKAEDDRKRQAALQLKQQQEAALKAEDDRKRQAERQLKQQEEAAEQKRQRELAQLYSPTNAALARQNALNVQRVDAELIAKLNDVAICAVQEVRTLPIVDAEITKRGLKCAALMERLR